MALTIERLLEAEAALNQRKIDDALSLFYRAEQEGCDRDRCSGGRWKCYMLLGFYEKAWRESDAIEARGRPDARRFWDGKAFDGKHVIVRCLNGLGDTLQFIRFAPRLREPAKSLTIEVQPVLKPLFRDLLQANDTFADQVITWGEPQPRWDTQVEVTELPRIFRTSIEDLLTFRPYLWRSHEGAEPRGKAGRLSIGLTWAAGGLDRARSISTELLDQLLNAPGIDWHSLQAGVQHAEAERWGTAINKICDQSTCILEVAREMAGLDLIITVDTMNAHLAGSLGIPVWTLLPFASNWRWMLDRKDTPWYPSMRLFRQPETGNWEQVISRVRRELGAFARGHSRTDPV